MFLKDEIEYFHIERVSAFGRVFIDTFRPGKARNFSKISTHRLTKFILLRLVGCYPKVTQTSTTIALSQTKILLLKSRGQGFFKTPKIIENGSVATENELFEISGAIATTFA